MQKFDIHKQVNVSSNLTAKCLAAFKELIRLRKRIINHDEDDPPFTHIYVLNEDEVYAVYEFFRLIEKETNYKYSFNCSCNPSNPPGKIHFIGTKARIRIEMKYSEKGELNHA